VNGFVKTTASLPVAPQDVEKRDNAWQIGEAKTRLQLPKRKPGGQPGNRNAFKTGLHMKEPRALRKQVTRWKRETNALMRMVQESNLST
jgi:hypothetical protein